MGNLLSLWGKGLPMRGARPDEAIVGVSGAYENQAKLAGASGRRLGLGGELSSHVGNNAVDGRQVFGDDLVVLDGDPKVIL